MEMNGEQSVPLSQQDVWGALNDSDVLAACIPGCESLEQTSDTEFKARVRTAVGPVNAQFKGRMTLSDMSPPDSYKLSFKGDGNAGFVQGNADVRLAPSQAGHGTTISYDAKAKVGGKLAQIGSRLIDGAAHKMADDFFANLTRHLGGDPKSEESAVTEKPALYKRPLWQGVGAGVLATIGGVVAWLFKRHRDS